MTTACLHCRAELRGRLDVEVAVEPGQRVAVLGANGAGKSTLLEVLAGTVRPDRGRAVLGDQVLFDLGSPQRWLPPHRRGVVLLAQDPLLFPHLSVIDNVAFGLTVRGVRRDQARERAKRWLDEVDARDLAERRPEQLSGGEAQRVALARALATEPRLLLLDEPLAALDVAVAPVLRRVLRRALASRTTLLVTHDVLDALLLSDRVLVLDEGRVMEQGPTEEVLRHPRGRFTAGLAGLNLIRGRATAGGLTAAGVHVDATTRDGQPLAASESAVAVFSPTDVSIFLEAPAGSPRNNLLVTITELEPRGEVVRVRAEDQQGHALAADVTPASVATLDLYPGRPVLFVVKAAAIRLYPS